MKRAVVQRQPLLKQTMFGVLRVDSLKLFTVERAWLDNANNVSCIPIGTYICKWTLSPRLKRFTYEIASVSKRAGIRIHPANFPKQLLGCVSLGLTTGTMDGERGVFSSVTAVRKFETYMQRQPFELEITNA